MNELDCKDIKALLSGLVDGELEAQTRHQAERHLGGCKPCRELVDEAERLNALLATDAQGPAGLPEGFADRVLHQTIYADAYNFAGRRWTSWLGWVAAAACLALAMTIWFVNPRGYSPSTTPTAVPAYASIAKSWTYDGNLSPESIARQRVAAQGRDFDPDVDEELARTMPAGSSAPLSASSYDSSLLTTSITRDDADAWYAASNLLDMLSRADLRSFADVERIRQIAEYDDLLDRLADSRSRLNWNDRPAVLAAESVLIRVVRGPLSLEDLRMVHDTVQQLNLADRIEDLSSRWQPESTL